MSTRRIAATLLAAHILSMLGFSTYAALLPELRDLVRARREEVEHPLLDVHRQHVPGHHAGGGAGEKEHRRGDFLGLGQAGQRRDGADACHQLGLRL